MSKTVAEVIIETLQQAGAKHCWGVPGDTLNHITDAIRRSEINWVHVRHEEAGGFAAGAEAMLTGRLTLCAGSCGPGSLHFVNGLFEAHRNRSPVVLIASQIVRDEQGFDFPQEVDYKPIYDQCSVFCQEIRTPAQARRVTAAAAQAALTKGGVAVIIVPADISKETAADEPPFAVHQPRPQTRPSDDELTRIAEVLNAGKKIAIYGGSGCQGAHAALMAVAARLKAPIAHTSRAKDFVEYDNPHNVGMTGIFGVASGYHAVSECDTLLLLGCDFAWRQFYPAHARIIQIDIDPTHLGRRHPIEIGAVGDIGATLTALLPLLQQHEDAAFLDHCVDRHQKAIAHLNERATAGDNGTIRPQYLTATIDKYAADDAIFTADGGSPMVWVLRHTRANGRRRTLVSLTHGTMANAMPQALGAKKAFPQRQVISLSGDGGLAMLMGDLITAVQENIAIKVAVYNNSSLGFVELEQKVEGLLDAYTDLKNPDFARVAEAIGIYGQRVETPAQLEEAVQAWLAHPGPALLDVTTDRFELVMPPTVEMKQVLGTALYSAKAVLSGRGQDVIDLVKDNLSK
ncbi:ubiquinone-dependent pyruvate dehydrogenase [Pseudoduganella sp. FT26W]|uniref:Ubiquinone-dependent pyruvate dehydrogenase n=1 Tax=Duganella aquatilis TaxID=2666082 RepID=A0A844CW60_9BURK|nr:thiamine pyrophosphate-dependent enzyme [Duganella aquatilis]MRW84138.1 ubiquinone-dependent pyruvate dehydrogenase [Duganella aquatilis]